MLSKLISVIVAGGLGIALVGEGGAIEPGRGGNIGSDLTAPWLLQLTPRGKLKIAPSLHSLQLRGTTSARRAVAAGSVPRNSATSSKWLPQTVPYKSSHSPGMIVIDTNNRFLYLVMSDGRARRYGVGVGRPGFEWAGTHRVTRKALWPDWRPPAEMIAREKKRGRDLPTFVAGGPSNPLGARALYLGSTLYRIHGSNEPWTIGQAVSSGCIRMRNVDVMDLYDRVNLGTRVSVL